MVDVPNEFGFDLLPSHLYLSDYELELSNLPARYRSANGFRLYNLVQKILAWHEYDFVLIDCNPSLGVITMQAVAAAASGGILIPTNLDLMSTRGVENLIDRIADVQEELLRATDGRVKHMGIIGVILNLYAERRTVDKTIQHDLERFYPFRIFKNTIPESVNAKKAVFAGVLYSQMYKKAEQAYMQLAAEVLDRLDEMETNGPLIQRLGEDLVGSEGIDGEVDE